MRKITQEAFTAFYSNYSYAKDNTTVIVYGTIMKPISELRLHNNLIAKNEDGTISICDGGGWITSTTRERLNSLPGVNLRIKNGEWILNGNKWDGSWITVWSL